MPYTQASFIARFTSVFYSQELYHQRCRQCAFGDLFNTTTTSGGGMTTMNAHQHQQHHGFDLPDPFRKFPSSVNVAAAANVEFNDELSMATLLGGPGDRSSPNGHHHHHHQITTVISTLTSSNSSMRTKRRMKTPRRRTAYSTYLRPAHRLPLLQHFRHTLFLFLHHHQQWRRRSRESAK